MSEQIVADPSFIIQFVLVEKMAENIREEIRRLHRRKQLSFGNSNAVEQMQDSESSGSEMGAESPCRPDTPPAAVKNPEMALFTFKQVRWHFELCCIGDNLFNRLNIPLLGSNDLRAYAQGRRREAP